MTENPQDLQVSADVSAQNIARVYAEALFNVALERGQAETIQEELDSLLDDLLAADPKVARFLTSGAIGRNQRRLVLDRVFSKLASPLFFNFLQVLNDHERLDLLHPIRRALRQLRDEHARRVRVMVKSAVSLSAQQQSQLQDLLRQTLKLEPLLETTVDPELLGGLLVRVGDWQYDATLRHQLEILRSEIIARSSHEIQSRRDRFSPAE